MTVSKPISVSVSLNKFNKAVLIKFVINPTSKLKFAKNSPVCMLSIVWVSTFINYLTKSTWTFFVTSCATFIIIIFAQYKEQPLAVNAIIIAKGILAVLVVLFSAPRVAYIFILKAWKAWQAWEAWKAWKASSLRALKWQLR